MNKYTPPPKFKGQNIDRGYTEQPKKEEKPQVSNQFPSRGKPKDNSNTRLPYND